MNNNTIWSWTNLRASSPWFAVRTNDSKDLFITIYEMAQDLLRQQPPREPMSSAAQVNTVVLQLLFMQVIQKALEDSRPSGADIPDQEAAFYRIEQLGFNAGQRLVERLLAHTQQSRFAEQIDMVKYLCKEFWMASFGKSIDNLKTNHRGVYVLQDQGFQWISRFGVDGTNPITAKMAVLVGSL